VELRDGDLLRQARRPHRPDRQHAEVSMLALHLLPSALVHINILLLQAVLEVPEFHDSIGGAERRALDPGCSGVTANPYDRLDLDLDTRLDLAAPPPESVV
jgi:hypothetical protein